MRELALVADWMLAETAGLGNGARASFSIETSTKSQVLLIGGMIVELEDFPPSLAGEFEIFLTRQLRLAVQAERKKKCDLSQDSGNLYSVLLSTVDRLKDTN
ncbi:MAG: hypothetical protein AB8C46_13660 [Burkholderiaceae bacterium]